MSASFVTEVAQAVTDALNAAVTAGTLAPRLTFERVYAPEIKLEEVQSEGIKGLVMAAATASEMAARSGPAAQRDEVQVQVGIWRFVGLGNFDLAHIDPLMQLVRDVWTVLRTVLTTSSGLSASYLRHAADPIYDQKQLREAGEFRSVTTFTFRVSHAV